MYKSLAFKEILCSFAMFWTLRIITGEVHLDDILGFLNKLVNKALENLIFLSIECIERENEKLSYLLKNLDV